MVRSATRPRRDAYQPAGGQPAISPWALVPQELIHPLVPLCRHVCRRGLKNLPRLRRATSAMTDVAAGMTRQSGYLVTR